MKLVDVAARNSKENELILRKMKALAKASDPHCEVADYGRMSNGNYYVQINGPVQISDRMGDIIRKSSNAKVVSEEEHVGHYDWASDTYIKDCSTVEYKF